MYMIPVCRGRLTGVIGCVLLAAAGACCQSVPEALPPRTRLVPRTLVFPRAQMKYGLDEDYLRRWVDRPLLLDPALRVETRKFSMTYPSFRRMLDVVRSYEVDGFAFFPETSGRRGAFEYADEAAVPGFHLLPEFIPGTDVEPKKEVLRLALECESVIRVNGRIPITSYRADRLTPEQWQAALQALRAEFGDVFFFLPDISTPLGEGWPTWVERFDSEIGISPQQRDSMKEYLRGYLRVCDGLYVASAASIKRDRKLHGVFYSQYIVPLFREVLAEAEFSAGKYLGFSACVAHANCTRLGYTLSDDGTKTLRHSLAAALSGEPDFLILPEWDEQNENTSFRPTVYNSYSSRRILRYTMQQLRGETPSPFPGDDPSLPNLVVSYRKLLTLGEALEIELLNIPDGTTEGPYEVSVRLLGPDGSVVARRDAVQLDPDVMSDVTWEIPSETLAAYPYLRPELSIRRQGVDARVVRDGLHHIQLRATWNWDYKWVKQPLRDVCMPETAHFDLEPEPGGGSLVWARGEVTCSEPIASVEVIENGAVVYAADPRRGALREREDLVLLAVEYRARKRMPFTGRLSVRGATCVWPERYSVPARDRRLDGNDLLLTYRADWYQRILYLGIPRSEIAQARLLVAAAPFDEEIGVQSILDRQILSLSGENGLTLTISEFCKQDDHPPHLDAPRWSFRTRVRPDMTDSVFHLRVITKSGRIFRSAPQRLATADSGRLLTLPVYSEQARRPVRVTVDMARVPDIDYAFEPRHGAALLAAAGRPFWAHMGGYTDSVTGRGGGESGDGNPFIRPTSYPAEARIMAPAWSVEDGRTCLRFADSGMYIAMPQGVLPRRGSFVLSFEVKPLEQKPQILFTHQGTYIGSLTVRLEEGQLSGSFTTDSLTTYRLASGLAVPVGEWSRIEVLYDLESIRFRVNGQTSPALPCKGPGLYDVPSVFGGFGQPAADVFDGASGWFNGFLSALRIQHYCPLD